SYACSHTPTLSAFSFFFSSSGHHPHLHSFPTRRSSDLAIPLESGVLGRVVGPPEMDGLIQRNRAKRVGSLQPEPLIDGDDVREIAFAAAQVDRGDRILQMRYAVVVERVGARLAAQQERARRAGPRVHPVAREIGA